MALLHNFKNSEGVVMTLGEVDKHLCELQGSIGNTPFSVW